MSETGFNGGELAKGAAAAVGASSRLTEPTSNGQADAAPVTPAASFDPSKSRYTVYVPSDETKLNLGLGDDENSRGIGAWTKTRIGMQATDDAVCSTLRIGKAIKGDDPSFKAGIVGITVGTIGMVAKEEFIVRAEKKVSIRSEKSSVELTAGAESRGERPSSLQLLPDGGIDCVADRSISLMACDHALKGKRPTVRAEIFAIADGKIGIRADEHIEINVGDCKVELGPGFIQLSNGAGANVSLIGPTVMISAPTSVLVNSPLFVHNGVPVKTGA